MPKAKPFTKEQILNAMDKTKSVRAAARYLNCSYQHLKPWMKQYKDEESGLSLFDLHKNPNGFGIPKFITHTPFGKKEPAILDIVEGRIDSSHFSPEKIRYRMIEAGLIEEKCTECGFQERRVNDFKMPLIMHFKDGNTKHYGLGNVHLLCYNCYFLYYGTVFSEREIEKLEGHGSVTMKTESEMFQLDDYQIQMLQKLGLQDKNDDDDPYSLVSFK
jgi:hypothetical protein